MIIPGVAVAFQWVSQEPKLVEPSPAQRPNDVLIVPSAVVVLGRLQSDGPQVGVLEVEGLQLGHSGKRFWREDCRGRDNTM